MPGDLSKVLRLDCTLIEWHTQPGQLCERALAGTSQRNRHRLQVTARTSRDVKSQRQQLLRLSEVTRGGDEGAERWTQLIVSNRSSLRELGDELLRLNTQRLRLTKRVLQRLSKTGLRLCILGSGLDGEPSGSSDGTECCRSSNGNGLE